MEFFGKKTAIDFMGCRRWAMIFSILICMGSIAILCAKGLNWGLEFTGGTEIQLHFKQAADVPHIREQLTEAGFKDVAVQIYGTSDTVLVRFAGKQDLQQKTMSEEIQHVLSNVEVQKVDYIGPQVGKELALNGALALFVAMLGTAVYIAFRFEYRFAVSASVALLHDPIIILGVFAWTQMEFDLVSLAAILTIIGYSLNDTIVVFDRVRENFRRLRKGTTEEIINLSVNQTLSRTIMTSGLTLLAVLALFLFGGEVLRGFSMALIIGIVVGTYSSIYIAGTLAVMMGLSRNDLLPAEKTVDDRP
jgi:preprotein translocase subunit SecF